MRRELQSEILRGWFWRLDLLLTIVMDAVILAVAIVARGGLLRVLAWAVPEGQAGWAIVALQFLLDVGLVGTAGALTVFDLGKRLKLGWAEARGFVTQTEPGAS